MSFRDNFRRTCNTSTALVPYLDYASAQLHFTDTKPRLTRRTIKITERREAEVIERKAGADSVTFFAIPPKPAETTKKWSSERSAEIEETFE